MRRRASHPGVPTQSVGTRMVPMSRTRYKVYEDWYPYFMTCTIVGWLPVFTRPQLVDIVFDSWRWLQQNRGLTLFGYVILENHLHFVAKCEAIAEVVGDFKSFTARKIIDAVRTRGETLLLKQLSWHKEAHKNDREYQVWQEGSHPQQIQHEDMMRQKLEYMHYNPVKRGYVDSPEHWRYSSARDYAGLPGLIPICREW